MGGVQYLVHHAYHGKPKVAGLDSFDRLLIARDERLKEEAKVRNPLPATLSMPSDGLSMFVARIPSCPRASCGVLPHSLSRLSDLSTDVTVSPLPSPFSPLPALFATVLACSRVRGNQRCRWAQQRRRLLLNLYTLVWGRLRPSAPEIRL